MEAAAELELLVASPGFDTLPPQERALSLYELAELLATYPDLGSPERATELYTRAIELADAGMNPRDGRRAQVHGQYGAHLTRQGKWKEATPFLEERLEYEKRALTPEQWSRSNTTAQLIEAYSRTDRTAEADALRHQREHPLARTGDVAEFPSDALYLQANARDEKGRAIYAHYTQADMPLRISLDVPESAAADSTPEATMRVAAAAFRSWAFAVRQVLPWFRVDIVGLDPSAPVQVRWTRRSGYFIGGIGTLDAQPTQEGGLRVTSEITLCTQPIPGKRPLDEGQVYRWALHAFGGALGLRDCWECESIRSMGWISGKKREISDLDLRTLEALMKHPNGALAPGQDLASANASTGVLADLPFINTGDDRAIHVNLAEPGQRPLLMLLDTGASDNVMSTAYARALGVSVRSVKSDPYRRPTIVGRPLVFWVTGQRAVGGGRLDGWNYGLLGGEFLKDYVVDIDFRARRVRFLDPEVYEVHPEDPQFPNEKVVEMPIPTTRPYLRIRAGNGEINALLDTGAMGELSITEELAEELGIPVDRNAPRRIYRNVIHQSESAVQRIDDVGIGDIELDDVELTISLRGTGVRISRMATGGDSLLGHEILRHFRVRLDYPRQRLGLTAYARDAVPKETPR